MFIQPIGGLSVQNKNYKSSASFGVNSNSINKVAKEVIEKAPKNVSEEVSGKATEKGFWGKVADFLSGDGDDAFAPGGPFDSDSINYP